MAIDHEALADLYSTRRVRWIELARRYGAGDEAEDVVHDVMVVVLEGLEPGDDNTLEQLISGRPGAEGGLIRLIASNRRRKRDWRARRRADEYGILPARYAEPDTPLRWDVQRIVEKTDDPELIWRYFSMGETERELARSRGISHQGIHYQIRQLVTGLRSALAAYRGGRGGARGEP